MSYRHVTVNPSRSFSGLDCRDPLGQFIALSFLMSCCDSPVLWVYQVTANTSLDVVGFMQTLGFLARTIWELKSLMMLTTRLTMVK